MGSSVLVIGGNDATRSNFINREEYLPFGETSFGSFARKRYRHSGKERDEESGLYYYGARYYVTQLCRWTSVEPMTLEPPAHSQFNRLYTMSPYAFNYLSPLRFVDPTGKLPIHFVMPIQDRVTSESLPRIHPKTGKSTFHQGMDFGVAEGTEVLSLASGVVSDVKYQEGGAGHHVVIQHGPKLQSDYMHLSDALVEKGEPITEGQPLGLSGNTGLSTGPHLHVEIRVKDPKTGQFVAINPRDVGDLQDYVSGKLPISKLYSMIPARLEMTALVKEEAALKKRDELLKAVDDMVSESMKRHEKLLEELEVHFNNMLVTPERPPATSDTGTMPTKREILCHP